MPNADYTQFMVMRRTGNGEEVEVFHRTYSGKTYGPNGDEPDLFPDEASARRACSQLPWVDPDEGEDASVIAVVRLHPLVK